MKSPVYTSQEIFYCYNSLYINIISYTYIYIGFIPCFYIFLKFSKKI